MSHGLTQLHSHSGIEREYKFPKYEVLVDEMFGDMFTQKQPFMFNGKLYYRVPTIDFVKKSGIFKNLNE